MCLRMCAITSTVHTVITKIEIWRRCNAAVDTVVRQVFQSCQAVLVMYYVRLHSDLLKWAIIFGQVVISEIECAAFIGFLLRLSLVFL